MTDTQPNSKPMWKRHRVCNQRVFNDPIDWEAHLRACPHETRVKLDRLLETLDKLNIRERLEQLEQPKPVTDLYAVDDDEPPATSDLHALDDVDETDIDDSADAAYQHATTLTDRDPDHGYPPISDPDSGYYRTVQ